MDGSANVTPKTEIHLSDYRPPDFKIKHVDLVAVLDGPKTRVVASLDVTRLNNQAEHLVLSGGPHMTLLAVDLDSETLSAGKSYDLKETSLTVLNVPDQFCLSVTTQLDPDSNTRLEGLFRSGGTYCTQCEAEGFRHITYFLDRPDVLSTYSVRLEALKAENPVLLSNGNFVQSGDLADGWHFAQWHDPIPKPCYLFAMVAGDLDCVSDRFETLSGRSVDLNIYVKAADIGRCGHAMDSLKRSMRWDEETYGLEYDLDLYNIVAVSDFNMGAMENKGLNIFNTKYVLADTETATDIDFDHVEGVIAHEYFHNWTGNRVTCRDWFQLSLKEGLTVYRDQQFSSDMTSAAVKRLDDVRLLRFIQFAEDDSPLAHPVRPDRYVEINNFYTATVYNKGAEVIRMMATLLGRDGFRKGMDLYFERHDGQAVCCEDFVAAVADATGTDLSSFQAWYGQSGTPHLEVRRLSYSGHVHLHVTQTTKPTSDQSDKRPLVIPFSLGFLSELGEPIEPTGITVNGVGSDRTDLAVLTEAESHVEISGVPESAVPSLLRGFSAPVRLTHDLTASDLVTLMKYDTDPFARWEAGQSLTTTIIRADLSGTQDRAVYDTWLSAMVDLVADTRSDPALIAEMLRLPNESLLAQGQDEVDPVAISLARERALKAISEASEATLFDRYRHFAALPFGMSQAEKAARRLKSILLGYLSFTPHGEDLINEQYASASNMTDRMAALHEICHYSAPSRAGIVADFFSRFDGNALVIDKWFAAQAMSRADDGTDLLRSLVSHAQFSVKNPNRLRSVASTLSYSNPRLFHKKDGSGYRFLADLIAEVDAINPQTAARLIAPLTSYAHLEPVRQGLLLSILTELRTRPATSDDLGELLDKALSNK